MWRSQEKGPPTQSTLSPQVLLLPTSVLSQDRNSDLQGVLFTPRLTFSRPHSLPLGLACPVHSLIGPVISREQGFPWGEWEGEEMSKWGRKMRTREPPRGKSTVWKVEQSPEGVLAQDGPDTHMPSNALPSPETEHVHPRAGFPSWCPVSCGKLTTPSYKDRPPSASSEVRLQATCHGL